ncbi:MAG: DNA polymerase I, partial [Rhodobiaceae bacterium]|nr:DNA polymerase I [Rhodobiaceae bacterium]
MTETLKKGDHLILVDGSTYIFRAYHALPPLTRKSDGLPVGAVSGFCNMLWKLLQDSNADGIEDDPPTHFAVIFDYSGKSFRNAIYPDYKAHRPPAPEDLVPQFGLIRDAVRAFSIACIEQEGYEADDIIATYAVDAAKDGAKVTIVSSDKDLMQLIRPGITMLDTMKNKVIDVPEVHEKFGVGPDKVIDVQSLAGDSTDNVPGVPGIGIKTAAQLIAEYGDVDTLLERASEIKQNKRRENLIEFADQARISRDLVTLKQDVPVEIPLSGLSVQPPDGPKLIAFLKAMEFNSLTRRVAEKTGAEVDAVDPASVAVEGWGDGPAAHGPDMADPADLPASASADVGWTPQAAADKAASALLAIPVNRDGYDCVTDLETLDQWIAAAHEQGHVAFDTETNSLDAMQADLAGFSLALAPGKACYVPVGHSAGDGLDFGGAGDIKQIPLKDALARLKDLLEAPGVLKIGQNLKYDMLVLAQHDITVAPIDDTMLMSYALDAGKGGHGMDALAERHLGHTCISFKEVAGTGKAMITFDKVPLDKATAYAAEDADITLRLWMLLKPRLLAEHMMTVYERLERPLVEVLMRMEEAGITVDRTILSRLSGDFAQKMAGLEAEIHDLAGEPFNLGSPKQVGDILFGK